MSQPMPPPYPGQYYPMSMEGMITRRNVFAINAIGLLAIWIGALIAIWSGDINARGLARFLVISGGVLGTLASTAGALGSQRAPGMQNPGLLIWAGRRLAASLPLPPSIGSGRSPQRP